MTPIEAMAKAHWHRCDHVKGFMPWDELLPETRAYDIEDMRAALLALAAADLPFEVIAAGAHWASPDIQDQRTAYVEASFRAMLRSIASEGESNG